VRLKAKEISPTVNHHHPRLFKAYFSRKLSLYMILFSPIKFHSTGAQICIITPVRNSLCDPVESVFMHFGLQGSVARRWMSQFNYCGGIPPTACSLSHYPCIQHSSSSKLVLIFSSCTVLFLFCPPYSVHNRSDIYGVYFWMVENECTTAQGFSRQL